MVDWVEKGDAYAPETVTGTKFINVSITLPWMMRYVNPKLTPNKDTVSLGVDFVRNHCRFPLRNVCLDATNYKKPEAWKCVL